MPRGVADEAPWTGVIVDLPSLAPRRDRGGSSTRDDNGSVSRVAPEGVAADARRGRLAVTSMQGNTLYLLPLP